MPVMQRLAVLLVAALSLSASGCVGFSYISQNYAILRPQVVTIGCNEPYDVYDSPYKNKMLVVSNGLREYLNCEPTKGIDPNLANTRVQRFRSAARTFLDETVREDCKISGETIFTDLQTEFFYTCSSPYDPKIAPLPGRSNVGLR